MKISPRQEFLSYLTKHGCVVALDLNRYDLITYLSLEKTLIRCLGDLQLSPNQHQLEIHTK